MDQPPSDPRPGVSRRAFIKGVIASGAVASSAAYLFRGSGDTIFGQTSAPGSVERLITLNVNGQMRPVDVMKQETLAMTLRYKLGLTGTKIGCDRAECGACTVLIDDVPHYSCSVLTHTVRGRQVRTIEGLATGAQLHPVQQAVVDAGVADTQSQEAAEDRRVDHRQVDQVHILRPAVDDQPAAEWSPVADSHGRGRGVGQSSESLSE